MVHPQMVGQHPGHMEPIDQEEDEDEFDDDNDEEQEPHKDQMFAEWVSVKRTKTKFKCEFKNAILHINGQDFVIK
jgi:hypothetical protein